MTEDNVETFLSFKGEKKVKYKLFYCRLRIEYKLIFFKQVKGRSYSLQYIYAAR